MYIKLKKNKEAIRILDAMTCQAQEEYQNILDYVIKIKCLVELDNIDDATDLTRKVDLILQSTRNLVFLKPISDQIILNLQELIEKFIEAKCFDTTMMLTQCKFNFINFHCDKGEERLEKFEEAGALLERLVREVMKACGRQKSEKPCDAFESVLREMLLIKDVSIENKAIKLAWVYKYFAFYCDEVGNYSRAVELNRQGITLMKAVFGAEAKKYKVFGHLYNNMGASLCKLRCYQRAHKAYEKALDVYNEAEDWKNQEVKYEIINQTKKSVQQTQRGR